VYRKNPHTAEALQNEIRNVTASNMAEKLQCTSHGFLRQRETCLRAEGNHIKPFV
jgi:hypothetical protein